MPSKVSIIGAGHVGSSLAFALVTRELCDRIVLVNRTRETAAGHAADLNHAAAFVPRAIHVDAGEVDDTSGSDVVVLTNSVPPPDGDLQDRMELLRGNVELYRQWVPGLAEANPSAVFVVVTNPVDPLTQITWRLSGLPARQVIGTGTIIDSLRYRSYLSDTLGIHADDIRAYILGEHGDAQFPLLSMSTTGGETLDGDRRAEALFEKTRGAGLEVYRLKGYTDFAIAMATTTIIESVIRDSRHTLPVSTLVDDFHGVGEVFLSLPAVIGAGGVCRLLHPRMSDGEVERWRAAAAKVKEALAGVEVD